MKLGMQVGLGPGHIVLDGELGTQVPLPQRAQPPIFGLCLLCPNGWMNQHATWYGGSIDPSDIVLYGTQLPLPKKEAEPPNFRPMSIVAKRLHGSRCHLVWR